MAFPFRVIYSAYYEKILKEDFIMSKNDAFALAMSVALGGLSFMVYYIGKFGGRSEAYTDCLSMVNDAIVEASKEQNNS